MGVVEGAEAVCAETDAKVATTTTKIEEHRGTRIIKPLKRATYQTALEAQDQPRQSHPR
jgi:hypothetical protein